MRNALTWSGVWIGLGLVFGVAIALRLGSDAGVAYLTAYLLEKSLSVDNLFLFVLIFRADRHSRPRCSIARCSGASSARW